MSELLPSELPLPHESNLNMLRKLYGHSQIFASNWSLSTKQVGFWPVWLKIVEVLQEWVQKPEN